MKYHCVNCNKIFSDLNSGFNELRKTKEWDVTCSNCDVKIEAKFDMPRWREIINKVVSSIMLGIIILFIFSGFINPIRIVEDNRLILRIIVACGLLLCGICLLIDWATYKNKQINGNKLMGSDSN